MNTAKVETKVKKQTHYHTPLIIDGHFIDSAAPKKK